MKKLSATAMCVGVCLSVLGAAVSANAQQVISVPAGGDLQSAIDRAVSGDTILLAPGTTYEGNFVLPPKAGDLFVTIRTAPDPRQPPAGVRVQPAHAPALARLVSGNSSPAIRTAGAAHHYRLMLLEFAANRAGAGEILQLGQADAAQTSLDQVPYALVIDRLYMHGDPLVGQKRGIALNSASTDIVNCYISDMKAVAQDSQAIAAMNGPGPYLIENNYLEGAGENFMAGGVDPRIPNLMPSDITFRYNYLSKPTSWRNPIVPTPTDVSAVAGPGVLPAGTYAYRVVAQRNVAGGASARSNASVEVSATIASETGTVAVSWAPVEGASSYRVYGRLPGSATEYWTTTSTTFVDDGSVGTAGSPGGGTVWSVKNLFELKNARRVVVEGNLMEYNWLAAQPGWAIVLTPRNSNKTCTWCAVQDVTFRLNTLRHVAGAVNILGWDNGSPSGQARGITFSDNLFYDVNKAAWGGRGWVVLLGDGPADIAFDHNTFDHDGTSAFYAYGSLLMTGIRITNNLMRHNNYGIFGDRTPTSSTFGNDTINAYFPDAVITSNVLAGGPASMYPAGNLFPTVADHEAQFTNLAGGDFSLVNGSSYASAGLDGRDLGANIAEVVRAAEIATSGAPIAVLNPVKITPTVLPRTTIGTSFSATLEATGGTGQYSWSLEGALPAGIQFDSTTATLSGIPVDYGTWPLRVTAADMTKPSNAATQLLTLTVWPTPVTISGASLPEGVMGRLATGALYAAGGTGRYQWSVVAGALPRGVAIDGATGTLSGTPSEVGSFAFTARVSDATYTDLSAEQSFSFTVKPAPVAILTQSLAGGIQGAPYAAVLEASGGASPLTWAISSGSLPSGLTLTADGRITGTPSATGSSTFAVIVIDSLYPSNAATATLKIAVTAPPVQSTTDDIVLYARRATRLAGTWQIVNDATAAGGARVGQPDAGAPKTVLPLASPANYFELSFTPEAGRAYHLWIRGKAQNNSWANDSVFVQFSGSVNAAGTPTYRIGTTSAATVNLEDGSGVGVSGWGWQDDGYGVNVLGSPIFFDGTRQKLRIQTREDGFSIDQIVLSPTTYFATAPGTLKNDTTLLVEYAGGANVTEVVMHATDVTAMSGTFNAIADETAAEGTAIGTPNAGAAKVATAVSVPVDYVELTFEAQANTPYRLWVRGKAENNSWANDSVFVQFSNSLDAAGTPTCRIGTTSATTVNLEDDNGAGVRGWGWQDNGWGPNVLGPLVYFATTGTQRIRVQVREDGYWFDQIVLSSQKYLNAAPGALKDDITILK